MARRLKREETLVPMNLSNALTKVTRWDDLGMALGIAQFQLNNIERSKMGDVNRCKLALIDKWLSIDIFASWEKLAQALQTIERFDIATEIREEYLQGGAEKAGECLTSPRDATGGSSPSTCKQSGEICNNVSSAGHSDSRQPMLAQDGDIRSVQWLIDADKEEPKLQKMVEFLSHNMVNLDIDVSKDQRGFTFLHECAFKKDLDSLKALIALGASVNVLNNFKHTPYETAIYAGAESVAEFLKKVGGVKGEHLGEMNTPSTKKRQRLVNNGEREVMTVARRGGERLILSLDSSSTLAIVQLEVLNQLEKATGRTISEMFGWIVASGVGGFLMLAMVYCKKSLADLRRLYYCLRERLFCGLPPNDRRKELEAFAVDTFGVDKRMMDADPPGDLKLLIGAVKKQSTSLESVSFSSFEEEYSTIHTWKVACYTCCTPLYVGEMDNFVDGGAICRNSSIVALGKVWEYSRLHQDTSPFGLVSIGDGWMPGLALGKLDNDNYKSHFLTSTAHLTTPGFSSRVDNHYKFEFYDLSVLLYSLHNGAVHVATDDENALSEEISKACASICLSRDQCYYRFNPLLEEYIQVPEEISLQLLIGAVLHTITQCQEESFKIQEFGQKFGVLFEC